MRDVTTEAPRARAQAHEYARVYTHTHTAMSHDVSRRSSRQILFRKIGLPLSSTTERRTHDTPTNSCASAYRADLTNIHVTCVRALLKNSRGYHPDLLLLQHSISPVSLLHTKPRYPTNFQYISTARDNVDRLW